MKSVFVTLIIFAVVFGLLSLNVLDFINNDIFAYFSEISLLLVVICAAMFVGLPKLHVVAFIKALREEFKKEEAENTKKVSPKKTPQRKGKNNEKN